MIVNAMGDDKKKPPECNAKTEKENYRYSPDGFYDVKPSWSPTETGLLAVEGDDT